LIHFEEGDSLTNVTKIPLKYVRFGNFMESESKTVLIIFFVRKQECISATKNDLCRIKMKYETALLVYAMQLMHRIEWYIAVMQLIKYNDLCEYFRRFWNLNISNFRELCSPFSDCCNSRELYWKLYCGMNNYDIESFDLPSKSIKSCLKKDKR
jgi:hypothetical protein